jgi:hypothetical protein
LSFAAPHFAPPDDPLTRLPDAAATKMVAIEQRAVDLRSQTPTYEQVQQTRLEVTGYKNRIADLVADRSAGGFEQDPASGQVISEKRKLERAEKELRRLETLKEIRTAKWADAARLHQAARDWTSRGIPGDCTLDVVADAPVAELLKKGETIANAVERFRHRQRELAADAHRIRSCPWPSSLAKAAAKALIDRLADQGQPDLDGAIEHGMDINFVTKRLTSQIYNVTNSPGAIAYAETDNAIGLMCWLFKDQLLAKINAEFDQIADDKSALSQAQREEMLAIVDVDDLLAQRSECSLIWHAAERGGEMIDFRATTSPQAVLGIALRTLPRADALPETSSGLSWPKLR